MPEKKEFEDFAKSIGYRPKNVQYLMEAFDFQKIHSRGDGVHRVNYANSAMATVGDAVLKLVLAEHYYESSEDKGGITTKKASEENDAVQSMVAERSGFMKLRYDETDSHPNNDQLPSGEKATSTLFEAVVYAIYKDIGLDGVRKWVIDWYMPTAKKE